MHKGQEEEIYRATGKRNERVRVGERKKRTISVASSLVVTTPSSSQLVSAVEKPQAAFSDSGPISGVMLTRHGLRQQDAPVQLSL